MRMVRNRLRMSFDAWITVSSPPAFLSELCAEISKPIPAESTISAAARSIVRWTIPESTISLNLDRRAGSFTATRSPSGCSVAALGSLGAVSWFMGLPSKAFNQRHSVSTGIEAHRARVPPEDLDAASVRVRVVDGPVPGRPPIEALTRVLDCHNQPAPLNPQHAGNALRRVLAAAVHHRIGERFPQQQFGRERIHIRTSSRAPALEFDEKALHRFERPGQFHSPLARAGFHFVTSTASSNRSSRTPAAGTGKSAAILAADSASESERCRTQSATKPSSPSSRPPPGEDSMKPSVYK